MIEAEDPREMRRKWIEHLDLNHSHLKVSTLAPQPCRVHRDTSGDKEYFRKPKSRDELSLVLSHVIHLEPFRTRHEEINWEERRLRPICTCGWRSAESMLDPWHMNGDTDEGWHDALEDLCHEHSPTYLLDMGWAIDAVVHEAQMDLSDDDEAFLRERAGLTAVPADTSAERFQANISLDGSSLSFTEAQELANSTGEAVSWSTGGGNLFSAPPAAIGTSGERHELVMPLERVGAGPEFRATCTCGWKGRAWGEQLGAVNQWGEHMTQDVLGPGDNLVIDLNGADL